MTTTKDLYDPNKLTGTVKEAAQVLGIGLNQGYQAVARGEIPIVEMGARKIVKWQPFLQMLRGDGA